MSLYNADPSESGSPSKAESKPAYEASNYDQEKVKKNLWHSLLELVGKRKDIIQANILVLGDKGCGKRSLIKKINKPFQKFLIANNKLEEFGSDFANFDCSYFYFRDLSEAGAAHQEENQQSRINVWMISDEEMGSMIPKILKPEDLEYTFAIIMPDLEQPWDIMNQCERWMQVLKDAIFQITP